MSIGGPHEVLPPHGLGNAKPGARVGAMSLAHSGRLKSRGDARSITFLERRRVEDPRFGTEEIGH